MPGYWCHTCNHPRSACTPAENGEPCAVVESIASEYRAELADGLHATPMINIHRLRNDNQGHYTQREVANEIFDAARRDGRDIQRAR